MTGITGSYIDPMESENVCIALFLRQGLAIYLQCECHDRQFFVLVINTRGVYRLPLCAVH